jgi:sec-independent protein translocase protein TatA
MFGLSFGHLLLLMLVGVLLFGGRLPEIGRSLGKALLEFQKGLKGLEDNARDQVTHEPPAQPPRSQP